MRVSPIRILPALAACCLFAGWWDGDGAGAAAKRVLTVDRCIAAHYKPVKIEGVCGGRSGYGPYVRRIKWSSYGTHKGTGTAEVSFGIVAGDPNFHPARIRVFRPRACKRIGAPIFTRLSWRFTASKPRGASSRGKHSFYCSDLAKP